MTLIGILNQKKRVFFKYDLLKKTNLTLTTKNTYNKESNVKDNVLMTSVSNQPENTIESFKMKDVERSYPLNTNSK